MRSSLLLVLVSSSILRFCTSVVSSLQPSHNDTTTVAAAISILKTMGVPEENLCSRTGDSRLPSCTDTRYLQELTEQEEENVKEDFEKDPWGFMVHVAGAAVCVVTAALAAGLTMGLLSLDPLMMMIKMRAGATEEEKQQAANILPIVQQHHLLLVTLLLINAVANEALPLFLEELVSPLVAVLLSVTLVLFGGEIIPSAIFTGPNKIALASKMTPVVRVVMFLSYPIAFPIAKLLDIVLHDESEGGDGFNRGELSALVRIQYEERLAFKRRHRQEALSTRSVNIRRSQRSYIDSTVMAPLQETHGEDDNDSFIGKEDLEIQSSPINVKRPSIHVDEVAMVEGALQMKTKMAWDACTKTKDMYAIPYQTILDEEMCASIYSQGYSRIPVYEPSPQQPKRRTRIVGVLLSRQLMVVNPADARPLETLPLFKPLCVSPKINMVDLLNIFQKGKEGHMALVCTRPSVAEKCLDDGKPVSDEAGFLGIITLEDVLEELLQEQVLDEFDKKEIKEDRLARWTVQKWKRFIRRKKNKVNMTDVVDMAMNSARQESEIGENTSLLGGNPKRKKFFGLF